MRPKNFSTRFYSDKQEKAIAKAIHGKQQSNSGATKFQKGDVTDEQWLIEAKTSTTAKASFSIKKEWLDKMKEEAFQMGKYYSSLCFDFGEDTKRYYVVDEKTFVEMKNSMKG